MDKLKFGDIVLLKFPYTDHQTFRRRPVLVINDLNDNDIIVCRITSQIYKTKHDIYIENWKSSGLRLPSVIRVHKIATLEKSMIETVMGKISDELKAKVKSLISSLAG